MCVLINSVDVDGESGMYVLVIGIVHTLIQHVSPLASPALRETVRSTCMLLDLGM